MAKTTKNSVNWKEINYISKLSLEKRGIVFECSDYSSFNRLLILFNCTTYSVQQYKSGSITKDECVSQINEHVHTYNNPTGGYEVL